MKRFLQFAICIFLLSPMAVAPAWAGEVIDGVVATVNHQPLLRSDWEEAICFEAFMRQRPLSQVTETDRVTALERLIDRQLLKAQMGHLQYMQPSEAALQQDLARLRDQVPNGKDEASWQKLLASYGLNQDSLKQHLRTEFQVMNFVEVRLRPTVHIQAEDVQAYYNKQLLPDLQQTGAKVLPLEEVEPKIRELLTQQRMDELLEVWLHNLRQQAEIYSTVSIPGVNAPANPAQVSGSH